jgi:hypothetical protein
MNRSLRIGLFVLLLLAVIGGSALAAQGLHTNKTPSLLAASGEPEASEAADAPPGADELARAVDRLKAHDLTATVDQLKTLADKYGLGGAIRLVAWSGSTGKTLDELSAMRDGGKGWGQIAHELGVSPGIGWIMGSGHNGSPKDKSHPAESASESAGD